MLLYPLLEFNSNSSSSCLDSSILISHISPLIKIFTIFIIFNQYFNINILNINYF